jgi:hypothetical protein
MAGVLSLLLVDLEAVIALIPAQYAPKDELPHWALLKLATVAQPAVFTMLAVILGIWLAPKVGLRSPAAEAFAERRDVISELRPQLLAGIVAGVFTGAAIAGSWLLARPYVSEDFATRSEAFNKVMPAAVRFLYGGLTEEVLLRWGMMTFLVWLLWRLFRRGSERPDGWIFLVSILLSALLFGIGHLPVASMLAAGGLTVALAIYVVAANSLFGLVAGLLYWKRGLESAMIAHIFAHVVLLTAVRLAL